MKTQSKSNLMEASLWFTIISFLLVVSMIVSVRFGSVYIPAADLISEVISFVRDGHTADTSSSLILWQIRIPRTIFAALCGMGLSLCGLVLQTMTRNDLADPYVLGVSSGILYVFYSYLDVDWLY